MGGDHYETLGIPPTATHGEVRAAYRRLMRAHHPDLRPGDPSAEEISRRLTEAWTVLGRPTARAAYDRRRSAARQRWVVPTRSPEDVQPAYSPAGRDYRRAFHLASVRVASVVLLVGIVVLFVLTR